MLNIRVAKPQDAAALLKIYAPYVRDTAITFEYDVPSQEEFSDRIKSVLERFPYLVAEENGVAVGYAYAGVFKARAAYDYAVETTVYVDMSCKHRGIGSALYNALEKCLAQQNITNLNACLGFPETEDEYLTRDSFYFHKKAGYTLVGEFHKCGYKFGRWYNMIWMEKLIGEHSEKQPPFLPFDSVRECIADKYGIR